MESPLTTTEVPLHVGLDGSENPTLGFHNMGDPWLALDSRDTSSSLLGNPPPCQPVSQGLGRGQQTALSPHEGVSAGCPGVFGCLSGIM